MHKVLLYSSELYHHGVKGMKWGVRRYQNYDGTRIGAGKGVGGGGGGGISPSNRVRLGTGEPQRGLAKKVANSSSNIAGGQGGKAEGNARFASRADNPWFKDTVKRGKGKDNITPAEDTARKIKDITNPTKDAINILEKHDRKAKKSAAEQAEKAKGMSEQDLKREINRIKLEREYTSLTSKETSKGYEIARDTLNLVGDVAEVAMLLGGLYLTYKKIKGVKHSDLNEISEVENTLRSCTDDEEFISHFMDLDDEYIEDWLEHHGIKGMKWGVRRYQNYDGTRIGGGGSNTSGSFRE